MLYLPDVNVLVALQWREHAHHEAAQTWFAELEDAQWASTPITAAGAIRVLSNPAVFEHAASPQETLQLWETNTAQPAHHHIACDLPFHRATTKMLIQGYRQLTDAYLLGLAHHHRATLVTFDQGIASLLAQRDPRRSALRVLRA